MLWPLVLTPTLLLHRSKREFRRVILRYSVCGSAESIVVERYHAQEVSHFDGKVRKSMDLRGNSRWPPKPPETESPSSCLWSGKPASSIFCGV